MREFVVGLGLVVRGGPPPAGPDGEVHVDHQVGELAVGEVGVGGSELDRVRAGVEGGQAFDQERASDGLAGAIGVRWPARCRGGVTGLGQRWPLAGVDRPDDFVKVGSACVGLGVQQDEGFEFAGREAEHACEGEGALGDWEAVAGGLLPQGSEAALGLILGHGAGEDHGDVADGDLSQTKGLLDGCDGEQAHEVAAGDDESPGVARRGRRIDRSAVA